MSPDNINIPAKNSRRIDTLALQRQIKPFVAIRQNRFARRHTFHQQSFDKLAWGNVNRPLSLNIINNGLGVFPGQYAHQAKTGWAFA